MVVGRLIFLHEGGCFGLGRKVEGLEISTCFVLERQQAFGDDFLSGFP